MSSIVASSDLVAPTLGVDEDQDGLHQWRGEGLQHEGTPFGLLQPQVDRTRHYKCIGKFRFCTLE